MGRLESEFWKTIEHAVDAGIVPMRIAMEAGYSPGSLHRLMSSKGEKFPRLDVADRLIEACLRLMEEKKPTPAAKSTKKKK